MTGFGRTGTMLACEHWNIKPDIVALGKGMGAGYAPIAAALVSDEVMEPILAGSKSIMSGHTLSANPQSCAVSLAVLEYIEKNNIIQEAESKGVYLRNKLTKLQSKFPFIGDVRGKGLMVGLEFVMDPLTKEPFTKSFGLTQRLIQEAQEQGLLIYPAGAGTNGTDGDAVLIAPPLTITKREIDDLVKRFEKTLQIFSDHLNPGEEEAE